MANKSKVSYICSNCGASFNVWTGRCSICSTWNSLEPVLNKPEGTKSSKLDVETSVSFQERDLKRLKLQDQSLNNIFGGGIVPGSVSLIAGAPGIGKSTLLLALIKDVEPKVKFLYVSAEESLDQVYLRANRLKLNYKNLFIANSNSTNEIINTIQSKQYDLIVVDSIQTISLDEINTSRGSITQISASANLIIEAAKASNVAVIIVGHITKDGYIAGPKVLEHLVDTVFQFEGDRFSNLKFLRATKNRFGSINEVIIYEMVDDGLRLVNSPSELLLQERMKTDGSIVHATLEGSRAILVEIQSLVSKTQYGYPKRATSGFDLNRLNLLIAMLEKRTKLRFSDQDIYLNVVGGINLKDPSADLAVCMSLASSLTNKVLTKDYVIAGEVGLSGEIRHIPYLVTRYEESIKLGFAGFIGPKDKSLTKSNYFPCNDVRTTLIEYLK
jgi:DNA repair protein RadA/Sms